MLLADYGNPAPAVSEVVDYGEAQRVDLQFDLLRESFEMRDKYLEQIGNRRYLAIIDFSRPSSEERLFLVDTATGKIMKMLVAHGEGSDPDEDGFADKFSNMSGSSMSSVGVYITAEQYFGANGLSLRLDGMEETNSTARERLIVLHGADYVDPRKKKQGMSRGCPAVSKRDAGMLIDKLSHGAFLYIVGPAIKA